MQENIQDLRMQKRTITIKFNCLTYKESLDNFIDELLPDLDIILRQRSTPNDLNIEVIIE